MMRLLATALRYRKWWLSWPHCTVWSWGVSRSSSAMVGFAAPNTLVDPAKSRLVVMITLVCPYSLLQRWNSNDPPA